MKFSPIKLIAPLLVLLVTSSLFFTSCTKGSDQIGLDLQEVNTNLNIFYSDTFTIKTSTVLIDSFSTTNGDRMLVGRYEDPYTGNIQAKSFFQVDLPSSFSIDKTKQFIYDSLVLSLDYHFKSTSTYTYSYGDTTKSQQISIYQLKDKLVTTTDYYNTDNVELESSPLASKTFISRPNLGRPFKIRLPDALGNEIFNLSEDGLISTSDNWLEYFKGLALVPGSSDNAAILAFNPSGDSSFVRLYYHQLSADSKTQTIKDFKFSTRFNQIKNDRSKTLIKPLQKKYDAIVGSKTNEETFIQSGVGLYTRIDFPYLNTLQYSGKIAINHADLVIYPVIGSVVNNFQPPTYLNMYTCDGTNQIRSALPQSYSSTSQIAYYLDHLTDDDGKRYIFGLNEYVQTKIRAVTATSDGLLLSPSNPLVEFNRLVVAGPENVKNRMKLRVYYTVGTN